MLGVIASNIADVGDFSDKLNARAVEHIILGPHTWQFECEVRTGNYMPVNFRDIGKGRINRDLLLRRLQERSISEVVNGGTLGALLESVVGVRTVAPKSSPLKIGVDAQKAAALKLGDILAKGDIKVGWLANAVPEFAAGVGVLNDVPPPLPMEVLQQAVLRARKAAANHRTATCWIDDGPASGSLTHDTDKKLRLLSNQPPPASRRLLIKVAAHGSHSPLDPPLVGETTIKWARPAHVSAILIDGVRGVITGRKNTLAMANDAGIAVIGV